MIIVFSGEDVESLLTSRKSVFPRTTRLKIARGSALGYKPISRSRKYIAWKVYMCIYTGCPRRNMPDFGRVFLMLKYTDITQNTYVQSWTVTEIMAIEKCRLLAGPRTEPVSWWSYPYPSLSVVSYNGNSAHSRSKQLMYFLLGDKALHVSAWHSCHV